MFKKTIKYVDFDGNEREEDFYFNLTKAELLKMELSEDGGLSNKLQAIVKAKDVPTITKLFEDIIKKSYGIKTPDGKGFVKSEKVLEEFMSTEAYSELFMELATNADAAADFINRIVPHTDDLKPITGTETKA